MKSAALQKFAEFVSNVFSPVVLFPVLLIVYLFSLQLDHSQRITSFVILFGAGIMPVLLALFLFRRFKLISDWDISQRRQRYLFNGVVFAVGLFLLLCLYAVNAISVLRVMLVVMFWFAGFSAITFFWKISAHTGSAMLFYLLISSITGLYSPVYFLMVPLVAWSRIYTKNHTLSQAVGGIILSTVIFAASKLLTLI